MEIRKRKGTLTIRLSETQTIVDVEEDLKRLKEYLSDSGGYKKVLVNPSKLKEIDTAYFQLLLALKETAARGNMAFEIRGRPPKALDEISKLYGICL